MSIYRSIAKQDPDALQAAIAKGEDVNAAAYRGVTHLHWAAERGWGDGIAALVKEGADPNVVNDSGDTPLMKAIVNRGPSAAAALLSAKANPETPNRIGATPLNWLVQMNAPGSMSMSRFVIVDGVKTEVPIDLSPQDQAARECLQALLAGGANPDGVDGRGASALACAAESNHLDFARLLIAAGADLNHGADEGVAPLMCARNRGHDDMVALLLKHGASDG